MAVPTLPVDVSEKRFGYRIVRWPLVVAAAVISMWFLRKYAFPYTHFAAESYGSYWTVRWWLASHILGGFVALLLGPFQFSTALRRHSLRLHRWVGRAYLSAIGIGGGAGLYMSVFVSRPGLAIPLFFLASVWLTCASIALLAIRRRNLQQHREWMIRSYVVTHGFVIFRLIYEVPYVARLGTERGITAGWFCWAVPLFIAEVALQWRRVVATERTCPRF